ncbi:hypothetical protein IQ264_05445 [Phormidium sp. LEGE 05292]|uniref:hypothetical protein n=1 Tax=[Phormidium] sp. LEGE 05292 TaxID=767427 RepID=UPI0018803A9F|nr:hypothetical protein [Phormidium sp. LEGE 05292]MBE9224910.1 hypothetical protein [Phormidium sp. LEGE 05292]
MPSQPQRKKEKSSSYLLRLTPAEKDRWHKMASFYALPLAEFIRRRVEGRPVSPPKVPAINARTSVQLGQFNLKLRGLEKDLQKAIASTEAQKSISKPTHQQLTEKIADVQNLLMEVRQELQEVRLQLSGVDENSENESEEISTESDFDGEDWD